MLIGDNLSSHFTDDVLTACRDNNVLFICIPPNSTHLSQPLDVAFYGPLKRYWRTILDEWKKKLKKKSQTITKECFPSLLNKLYKKVVDGETSTNLVSGFRKCGIHPIDRSQIISRLPNKQPTEDVPFEQTIHTVSNAVLDMLKELRPSTSNNPRKKRTKVNVEPGKSIQCEDLDGHEAADDEEEDEPPSTLDLQRDSDQSDGNMDNVSSDESNDNIAPIFGLNDYVVVKLPSLKETYAVARILEHKNDALSVKMFTKVHSKFVPLMDGQILPGQVVKTLSPPFQTRRGFTFNDDEMACFAFE